MGAGVSKKDALNNTINVAPPPTTTNNDHDNNNPKIDPLESTVRPASLTGKAALASTTTTTTTATASPAPTPPPPVVNGSPQKKNILAPHFAISVEDLEILQAVGEGGFCRVHKARFVQDKSTVAVKKLKGMESPSASTLESFKKEIALHSKIRHPHVIQFFGGCTVPPDLCLVTEFMFCSLQTALDNDPSAFHPQFEVETSLCSALGLNQLH
jgi:hypothetical protein